jgi:hypothetical protein
VSGAAVVVQISQRVFPWINVSAASVPVSSLVVVDFATAI